MRPLVIIGAGGHGREALDIVTAINEVEPTYEFLGFLDDGLKVGEIVAQHKLLGGIRMLRTLEAEYVIAIGATATRRRVANALEAVANTPASLIHPLASMGGEVIYDDGLIMAAGARVTHGVVLGKHVHINVNSSISHDCWVGDYVTITPGSHVSGSVRIEDEVWLGIGAVVRQGATLESGVTVGAGAVVVDDLPAQCTAIGVPARPI